VFEHARQGVIFVRVTLRIEKAALFAMVDIIPSILLHRSSCSIFCSCSPTHLISKDDSRFGQSLGEGDAVRVRRCEVG